MVDINKPVTNPELVKAIEDMNLNMSNEALNHVIGIAMNAHFLTPVKIAPPPTPHKGSHKTTLKKDSVMQLSMIEDNQNRKYHLAFTDWDELRKWNNDKEQDALVVTFVDLIDLALNAKDNSDGFVINPMGGNVLFNKALIENIKENIDKRAKGGFEEYSVEKDTSVILGQPKNYPIEMVEAVSGYLKNQKHVKKAFLQLMYKEGEQSYLLIIDFTGDRRKVFDGIAKAATNHLNGMLLDIVPYDCDFGRKATNNIKPFYKKGLFK